MSIDLIDLYDVCPACGHDWGAHFQMIEDDGTSIGRLIDPKPRHCMECTDDPGCDCSINPGRGTF